MATPPPPHNEWILNLTAADKLDDDLSSFGTWVGPRTGLFKRDHKQKEAYVLRRVVVALREAGLLTYPTAIRFGHPDDDKEPDFVLRDPSGSLYGMEVTEAGSEQLQERTSFAEKSPDNSIFLMSDDGFNDASTARDFSDAINKKIKKRRAGNYSQIQLCDLLIYDNTGQSGLFPIDDGIGLLRQEYGTIPDFRHVHILSGCHVILDVFGKAPRKINISNIYEIDFAHWVQDQIDKLKSSNHGNLDIANLAEELATLGRKEKNTLKSQTRRLLLHLLKWQFQPTHRTSSWTDSINNARAEIEDTLDTSPSLEGDWVKIIDAEYPRARRKAADETGLDLSLFPENCPYNATQLADDYFLPNGQGE